MAPAASVAGQALWPEQVVPIAGRDAIPITLLVEHGCPTGLSIAALEQAFRGCNPGGLTRPASGNRGERANRHGGVLLRHLTSRGADRRRDAFRQRNGTSLRLRLTARTNSGATAAGCML